MLLLSARAGRLSARIGPRLPMTLGPLLVGAGFVLYTRIGPGSAYLTDVLPGMLVFAFGLTLTVAPLTATVLAAAPDEHAGVASAVNNDVARAAGLLAVAILPVAAGISGADALDPAHFDQGFHMAVLIAATLCTTGALISWFGIRNPAKEPTPSRELVEPAPTTASDIDLLHCPLSAPPLRHPTTSQQR
jgi:MFS family permease